MAGGPRSRARSCTWGSISYGVFLWHLMLLRLLMPALGIP